MRTNLRPRHAWLAVAVLAIAATALPAFAGSFVHDAIHEDSFGNLIIQSPSGYKRIVVGKGYLAAELNAEILGEEPPVVSYEPADGVGGYSRHCNRQPVLLHGRSYMYGLPDNVVPVPAGLCR